MIENEKLDGGGSLCRVSMPLAVILRSISRRPAVAVAVIAVGVFVLSSLDWKRATGGVSV